MTLAILVALAEEAGPLLRDGEWSRLPPTPSLRRLYRRGGDATEAVLAVGGPGRGAAEAAGREVLERFHPRALVSAGLAGALQPDLEPGRVVLADRLAPATAEDGRWLAADAPLLEAAGQALERRGIPCRVGACITAPSPVGSPGAKARLGRATGALAVEMEGYWLGSLCRARGVPFLAVRVVLDRQGQAVPPPMAAAGDALGWPGRALALAPLAAMPWELLRALSVYRSLGRARASLGRLGPALMEAASAAAPAGAASGQ